MGCCTARPNNEKLSMIPFEGGRSKLDNKSKEKLSEDDDNSKRIATENRTEEDSNEKDESKKEVSRTPRDESKEGKMKTAKEKPIGPQIDLTSEENRKEFSLVWLDPEIDSKDNEQYRAIFDNYFAEVITSKDSNIKESIRKAQAQIVFLSCGSEYEKIRTFVEDSTVVIAVFIFCKGFYNYEKYKKYRKVRIITDKLEELLNSLRELHAEIHFQRFLEDRQERMFYDLSDKDKIIKLLTMVCKEEKFSVFYPLAFNKYTFENYLTQKAIEKIMAVTEKDKKLDIYREKIMRALTFLKKENLTPERIIESYTMKGFYVMLNQYLRSGSKEGFEVFKEYMFSLKACICQRGIPITELGVKLYRGLSVRGDSVAKYEEKKNQIVLLNSFTPMTLNADQAMEFLFKSAVDEDAILEVTTVNPDDSFAKFIIDFGFPEKSGVYFPANISAFSEYKMEQEVLFPPFYPIKIIGVSNCSFKDRKYVKITAETPYSVYITGKNHSESYVQSLFDLIEKKVVDKLSLVKVGLRENKDLQQSIEAKLRKNIECQKYTFSMIILNTYTLYSLQY